MTFIFFLSTSLILFGSYYNYDLPAALASSIDQQGKLFKICLSYAAYSLPNVIVPLLYQPTSSPRSSIIILSALSLVASILFATGVQFNCTSMIFISRLLLGASGKSFGLTLGESLGVSQSQLASLVLDPGLLMMTRSLNICIARLGSVVNDLVSPILAPFTALWIAVIVSIVSFMAAIVSCTFPDQAEEETDV